MNADTLNALAPYDALRAQIAALKTENAKTVFRYDDPKGNKLARSHVAGLRGMKGDVERKRKELKADALEYGRKVDSVAKELTGELDAMIEVHQGPLDLIESREEARKASIAMPRDPVQTIESCEAIIASVKMVKIDDSWGDKAKALATQAATIATLQSSLDYMLAAKAEHEELERLREEQAKRDAEARAKAEAEARAKREEEIRAEAEAKARREAADAAMAEARKKEAEAQAAINAEREKTRKAELAAAKAKQEAAEAEANREREEREKREADARRAANVRHRTRVLNEVLFDLNSLGCGCDAEALGAVVEALAAGKVRHVTVNF